jgi:2-dehydropantoate 2-reductase
MRVAVIGAGAVGCYYGGRLAEAGHDVRFLMRRDYEAVLSDGLTVTSPDGDFRVEKPFVARTSEALGEADWVVCALKATSLADAEALLRPCVGEGTRVLVLMNGLGVEERFAAWFGEERVFGGLAFTCINRGEPGFVHHLGYGAVTVGHFRDNPAQLAEAARLWQGSRVQVATAPSLLRARWEKLCWNIPFNGMTIAAGGVATGWVLADAALREETRTLMKEVVAVGNADLARQGDEGRIDGEEMIGRMFRLTETMGDYRPSTLIDFLEGRPLEVDAIFGEPLRRARSLDVDTPRLAMMTAVLRSLDARLRGTTSA